MIEPDNHSHFLVYPPRNAKEELSTTVGKTTQEIHTCDECRRRSIVSFWEQTGLLT